MKGKVMYDNKHACVSEVVMDAIPGGNIDGSLHEALMVCVKEKRRVRLRHNGTEYVVDIHDLKAAFSLVPDKRIAATP